MTDLNERKIVLYPAEGGGNDIPCFGVLTIDSGIVDVYYHDSIRHNGNKFLCVPDWFTLEESLQSEPWYSERSGKLITGSKIINLNGRKYFYEENGSEYDPDAQYTYTQFDPSVY